MSVVDLFLFDLAGTTVRDDGWVVDAFKAAAASVGLEPTDAWLKLRMGMHKLRVFEQMLASNGLDTSQAPALTARFDESVATTVRESGVRTLDGAPESIEAMQGAGIKVGFTTGFGRETAMLVVSGAGFPTEVVVASDEVDNGRPSPELIQEGMRRAGVSDPGRVGVAGDTPSDLEAGTNAGCALVIGVGHGSHTLAELGSSPHTHLLQDLRALPGLLEFKGTL